MTARLTAPITTGLRSRNGLLIGVPSKLFGGATLRGPRGLAAAERSGGAARPWGEALRRRRTSWGGSSEITPVGAGGVLGRHRLAAGQLDLALEVAEVEVEPR